MEEYFFFRESVIIISSTYTDELLRFYIDRFGGCDSQDIALLRSIQQAYQIFRSTATYFQLLSDRNIRQCEIFREIVTKVTYIRREKERI